MCTSNSLLYHTTREHPIYIHHIQSRNMINSSTSDVVLHQIIMDADPNHGVVHPTRSWYPTSLLRLHTNAAHANMNANDNKSHSNAQHGHIPQLRNPIPFQPIKLGRVPDSIQHDEASEKVIPENIIRGGRSGRWSGHRIGLLEDIIHNIPYFIHLDPISAWSLVQSRLKRRRSKQWMHCTGALSYSSYDVIFNVMTSWNYTSPT